MNEDAIQDEIVGITEHLFNNYSAHETLSIIISVLATILNNLENESRQHAIKEMYEILDNIKYGEMEQLITSTKH